MKKVRLGLIGCGRISKNHFDAITQIPEAELWPAQTSLKTRLARQPRHTK